MLLHRWTNPKAKPFKSLKNGTGLIAAQNISKGEIIQVVGGLVLSRIDIHEYQERIGHIGIQFHDDFWLVPASMEEINETGALNHSCEPNTGFEGSNIYVAIHDIAAGEEICVDYAFMETEFKAFDCRCGSPGCRKTITKDDWKIREIQEKYGNYFSFYLKKNISH